MPLGCLVPVFMESALESELFRWSDLGLYLEGLVWNL